MNFNSWQFLLFFPVVTALYWALGRVCGASRRTLVKQAFLLVASLFFYACWNPAYLVLIVFSVLITWISAYYMEDKPLRKRLILVVSLTLNLMVLFFFKYYNFFADNLSFVSGGTILPTFNVLLPVGISFYTFQSLSYSIDVYWGTVQAERNLITYALFVTFFPQLVAGPIERTGNLLPQFKADHGFDYNRVTSGLKLAAWGMFKKIVIADRVALYVDAVYSEAAVYPAASLALATFFFAFQIYCDFSGYSDIAIGCARVLGFKLMSNFRQPYFAHSVADFWRRWHISLSSWLRDYIYIPLGGNRRGVPRQAFNLLITFLLSGLWHGAAWHFVAWGTLHGVFQLAGRATSDGRSSIWCKLGIANSRLAHIAAVCVTFALVCIAWVFFRANTIGDALLICAKFAALPSELASYVRQLPQTGLIETVRAAFQLGNNVAHPIKLFGISACGLSFMAIAALLLVDWWTRTRPGTTLIMRKPLMLRWAGYYALVLVVLLSWSTDSSEFIYFTF
ncbi:MAG: MBOAT family protein [Treponema sp.]|jgi:D-alanyl-lipoteichoic acid acyltransferase DltB (MBOAT superfamily)|nr:MBOAT family protein [Treponema sp.]